MSTYITLTHNPTTITTPVYGIFGLAGTAWRVVNESTVGFLGIQLESGGAVINGSPGNTGASSLSGYTSTFHGAGVFIRGGRGSVANFGTLEGGWGVLLYGGGTVVNGAPGTTRALIEGSDPTYGSGIEILGGVGSVANFGTVAGPRFNGAGVDIETPAGVSLTGGALTNGAASARGASITGATRGVLILGAAGQITNFGTITGNIGLVVESATTVRNFGKIAGSGGTAVEFITTAGRLVVEPGAQFLGPSGTPGKVDGGFSTLELAPRSAGTLDLNGQFINFRTVIVDAGGDWRVDVKGESLRNETLVGSGGANVLTFTDAGAFDLSEVHGFPTIRLAGTGPNTLTLLSSNFAGIAGKTITVAGGNAADVLSEAGVAAADRALLRGGAGNDTLIAGPNAMLTGGAGADVLELTVPGSLVTPDKNTIADFTHGVDKLALSKNGFAFGAAPAAATLFTANTTGSFANPNQRFAYDTTNGDLFYDSLGNAAGSTRLEIAAMTSHPTLSAADITFVA